MDIWKMIWIAALLIGIVGFVFVALKITIRGFSETRGLLKEMTEV